MTRNGLRTKAAGESGFTLIELLIVMLILGILAAIAIPSFLNQRTKADDSQAKAMARSLQTTMESCSTDNRGSYTPCDLTALRAITPSIPATGTLALPAYLGNLYVVGASTSAGNTFYITKTAGGTVFRSCTVPTGNNRGGCRTGDTW
jgi:type IV pilus assembly protein PilA